LGFIVLGLEAPKLEFGRAPSSLISGSKGLLGTLKKV